MYFPYEQWSVKNGSCDITHDDGRRLKERYCNRLKRFNIFTRALFSLS